MKKIRKHFFAALFSFVYLSSASAVELAPTQELLAAFLEKDTDIQTAAISYLQSQLNNQKTQINNGFDITLSTGTMRFTTSGDGSSFSVSPSVQASLPQASNLGINVSSGMEVSSGGTELKDSSIKLSVDIISSSALNRKITLMQAERKVLEAKRNFELISLNKEKEFYSTLSDLLNQISSIISKQQDLYDHVISFEEVKAKGYGEKTSNYRSAQMRVQSDEHDVQKAIKKLRSEYVLFYQKCGRQFTIDDNTDFMSLIPQDIPVVEALNIRDFNPDAYTETEKAKWTHELAELNREAKKDFTLSANGGFTYKNSNTNNSNTIDLGLSSTFGGLSVTPGISIPVGTESLSPIITLGVSVNPNKFRTNSIDSQISLLDRTQELINIEKAESNYQDKVTQQEMELSNLLWEQSTTEEYYKTYKLLEDDMKKWYKQGIVTESKYLSAKVNREKYDVNKVTNLIDMILYNDTVTGLFYSDVNTDSGAEND